jgi:hypothetical protein
MLIRLLGVNATPSHRPRELHSRADAGVHVSLWWSPTSGRTWVTVLDARTDARFELPVLAGEQARDVFDHPYAYAARRGIRTARRVVAA